MTGYEANTKRTRSPLRPPVRTPVQGNDYSYFGGGRVSFAPPESSSGAGLGSLIRRDSLTSLYTRWVSDGPAPGLTSSPWPYESSSLSSYIPSAREAPSRYSSRYTPTASASPYSSFKAYNPPSTISPYSSLDAYTPTSTTPPYSSLDRYTPTSTTTTTTTPYTPTTSPYSSLSTYTPLYAGTAASGTISSAEIGPTWGEYYASRTSRESTSKSSWSKGKEVDYGKGR
ncbi:hypothetical protein C8A05DRAFT_38343 [Staphylotrichum tortipilum]|uniref:Uncharacterized protein n=1 Tax=Staphylotrichum tortipilum TaxID=2831512 RepID=A0AAN6RNY8_9PEZI|nr:hypothetical protein C8A05DRAFT_38343 [Staphylotrichum longicolle]